MAEIPVEKVETVMGAKLLSELGVTLTHEHLASNYIQIPNYSEDINPRKTINLWNYAVHKESNTLDGNLYFSDSFGVRSFYYDICDFKKNGGQTIVDISNHNSNRDFRLLYTICRTTKINVLVGTGFSMITKVDTETLYNIMRNDLEEGFDWNMIPPWFRPLKYSDVKTKAAFIGEVSSNWPINDYDRCSIAATAQVQEQLRCPVSFTPSILDSNSPAEILRIYQEAGGHTSKVIMSSVDSVLNDRANFFEFVDNTKCYVQFSLFGFDNSTVCNAFCNCNVLSDVQRVKRISMMKEENLLHRVLMSHNIYSKDRLLSYGGHGYSFIMKHIIPYMRQKNFTDEEINELIILNPMRWLKRG